ncbi:putative pectate lyase superfamily protein [Aeromonas phage ZPAH34]|uniref:tail fiber protein n=1 Tax=Aeromonas phage ZPAH34 TaxID=2924888 RepID=UPI00232913B5|nr:tail fiber protein [Aeromonas phage ZPAH34]UOX39456.1 putative pectate lyase superfamily protein [Aeromonas phage ZPAH34]
MANNTGNPIGSIDLRDLQDNARNLDFLINGDADSYYDRFNKKRVSIAGLTKKIEGLSSDIKSFGGILDEAANWGAIPANDSEELGGPLGPLNKQAKALANRTLVLKNQNREALKRILAESHLNLVDGSFEEGGVLTSNKDVLLKESTGLVYGLINGTYPYIVNENTVPSSSWEVKFNKPVLDLLGEEGGASFINGLEIFVSSPLFNGGAKVSKNNNDTAIILAINAALELNKYLYWPDVYEVQDSIPNFHKVRHIGPGGIKRAGKIFKVTPTSLDKNDLYVGGVGGSSTNDGLTVDKPFNNFSAAFDAIRNYGPILKGVWTLNVASGLYNFSTSGYQYLDYLQTENRIIIKGPDVGGHPNVPTAIINGKFTAPAVAPDYQHGIGIIGFGLKVTLKDIKFVDFNGDPSGRTRGALLIDEGADVFTDNVHVTNASWFGIYASRRSAIRQKGGILDNCRNGVVSDMAKLSLGYGSKDISTAPIVKNCTESGVYFVRESDGHADYLIFENNAIGLMIGANSRVDAVSCDFRKNNIAVRTAVGGLFGDNPYSKCNFNTGTALANNIDVDYQAYSGNIDELSNSYTEVRVGSVRVPLPVSGTQTVNSLIYTFTAGRLKGYHKNVRVKLMGSIATITAGSAIKINLGNISVNAVVPAAGTNVSFILDVEFYEVQGGWRAYGTLLQGFNTPRVVGGAGVLSVDNVVETSIDITLAGAGDGITIIKSEVFVTG